MSSNYSTYQRLMPHRMKKILIISSPYDAFIMEQDGGLLEHVFMQVRGISLVEPPLFKVVSNSSQGLEALKKEHFDLVVTMPQTIGMNTIAFGRLVKRMASNLPVVILAHSRKNIEHLGPIPREAIDNVFIWSGDRTIMWTIIKWCEDKLNADHDTSQASVRVLILIEDSPYHYSSLLPILYKSILKQTQMVLDDSLNEEHRLYQVRARPKILLGKNYEEGMALYKKYKTNLIGVFSDTRFPREGKIDPEAGIRFLKMVRSDSPSLATLLLSTEKSNMQKASEIHTSFLDKNSSSLHREIRHFMVKSMGFGDFVFRFPNGEEVGRAHNLSSLEEALKTIPNESLVYHVSLNHFSNWLLARSETILATQFRAKKYSDFSDLDSIREFLLIHLSQARISRQRGVISTFKPIEFNPDSAFLKLGEGSLGGKARGLAFMSKFLQQHDTEINKFDKVNITIPRTIVAATDCYDDFIEENDLGDYFKVNCSNEETDTLFAKKHLPGYLEQCLRVFLNKVNYPLAVRSSSLLEDSKDEPFAGLYTTFMLPNNAESIEERLSDLSFAIKMVYASVFHEGPKAFSRTTQHRTEEEKMAVVIQQIIGKNQSDYFYPALSGTAQSHNFYPLSYMKSKEGVAHLSLGLGKIVVEGGQTLRFSPKYPQSIAQFSSVDSILRNSQKTFFALSMKGDQELGPNEDSYLARREIYEARNERPIQLLSSSYIPADHVIRDYYTDTGSPILTFANILKYNQIPIPEILTTLIEHGKMGFGSDIELEFAINIAESSNEVTEFVLLQIRPMTTQQQALHINITNKDKEDAISFSSNALGSGEITHLNDVIFVKPEAFSGKNNPLIAKEISKLNAQLEEKNKKYLLLGPGRWGSSDQCLGVPVGWSDISSVGCIIEASTKHFRADPSQGTHFFQNITSLGIAYMTVDQEPDFVNWEWFKAQNIVYESDFICHAQLKNNLFIKIDGKKNHGVLKG